MQKTPIFQLIREELTRALVFGTGFFMILAIGFVGVAHAANGGAFGDILSKILASGNWEAAGDGTVKNAQKLGGKLPSEFVPVNASQTCPVGQCVSGFNPDGSVQCIMP